MTFRLRVTIALALVALAPLGLAGWGIRRAVTRRLTDQADRRIAALVGATRATLDAEMGRTRSRLGTLASDLAGDNRFRLGLGSENRSWILDWAGEAMRASGLSLLLLEDESGRVVSSGHFRNEYDRTIPGLPAMVSRAGAGGALVTTRTADGIVAALTGVDSLTVAGRRFFLVGGTRLDSAAIAGLAPDGEIRVSLARGNAPAGGIDRVELVAIDVTGAAPVASPARLVFIRDPGPVAELRREVDRLFLLALALTILGVGLISWWLGRRISEPLAALAGKAERLDLDRLDQQFDSGREDEVGTLGRGLDAMASRLRLSLGRLREAERRATMGDLARQINHDVKNGLIPIRNVVRHLTATAADEPDKLAQIYGERRATLESSIEYLEGLARNYARLSPALDREKTDVNRLVAEMARSFGADRGSIECRLDPSGPFARADSVALRRVVENLVANAIDAGPGAIVISTEAIGAGQVRIAVRDSGRGMTEAELERAFQDFYTTKADGTGLGLSVVRRLVADLGGALRVETAPGRGSTFTVEIPSG